MEGPLSVPRRGKGRLTNAIRRDMTSVRNHDKGDTNDRSGAQHALPDLVRQLEVGHGISAVICSHNGAARLPTALSHLASQDVSADVPWEVIVIDNASTDDTTQVTRRSWPPGAHAPLKVIYEPHLGLSFARHRGLLEASYEFVSFIDDDNWVSPDWVTLAFDVMSRKPSIGACGGFSEAASACHPPVWFQAYQGAYAVGPQGPRPGDVTEAQRYWWGSGLTVRRAAWRLLVNSGFRSLLTDRRGGKLTAGGDSELCMAIRLAGWRFWYEPNLRLRHHLPTHRLTWSYLRRLHRGFGASSVGLDSYLALLDIDKATPGRTWRHECLGAAKELISFRGWLAKSLVTSCEGNDYTLRIEWLIGRALELMRGRQAYDRSFHTVKALRERLEDNSGHPRQPAIGSGALSMHVWE